MGAPERNALPAPATPPKPAAPASSAKPDWLRTKSDEPADAPPAPSGWTTSRVLALLLVAGLGGFAVVQRRRRRSASPIPGASGLRVLESARIGPKAYLVTAAVGKRVLVLGVTDQSVSRLGVLRGNPAAEATSAREVTSAANDAAPRTPRERIVPKDTSFATMLRSALGIPRAEKPDDLLMTASRTREVLDLGATTPQGRPRATPESDEPLIDVEAQAAGLVRRLKEKKP
ncbi:MAG: flagellar biosynthetic protein FliO [Pseudomonadota bacterium]|nr:MAG: hypothetical protein DIU78_01270 [Pseudomonadota bacterium]